jgi:hypothetical protein
MYLRLVPAHQRALLEEAPARDEFVRRAQETDWDARGRASLLGERAEMRALRRLAEEEVDALAEAVLGAEEGALFTGGADDARRCRAACSCAAA